MTVSASRPLNFIFRSLPVRHSESRSPTDPGERALLARQPYLFKSHAWQRLPIRHSEYCFPEERWLEPPQPDKLTFSILQPARYTHPDCEYLSPVGWRREPPFHTTLPFPSLPVRHSEYWSPDGRRWEHSRPDSLTFSSHSLGEAYPSDTVSIELPSDDSESLPARQTYLFHPAAGETYPSMLRVTVSRRMWGRPPDQTTYLFVLLVWLNEPQSPDGRQRKHSQPDNVTFSNYFFYLPSRQDPLVQRRSIVV